MRSKEEILKDGTRPEYLTLEVLVDIRDELVKHGKLLKGKKKVVKAKSK